jgi:hypothetical protein
MDIDLTITGLSDVKSGHIIYDTIHHTLNTLMPKRLKPVYIDVEIALDEDMGIAKGLVNDEDEDTFFMSLAQSLQNDHEELIRTVCHECVHIKQYLRKEIRDITIDTKRWKKEVFDLRETDYADLPWEKEAHFLEWVLSNQVLKAHA